MNKENENNIDIENHGGLICDNTKCDWKDETIGIVEYKDWLNKPCPKCGDNLLTEEDYKNVETVLKAVELINQMSEEDIETLNNGITPELLKSLGINGTELLNGDLDNESEKIGMSISTHGEIKIDIKKEKD